MLALLEYFWDAWPEGEPQVSASATAVVAVVTSLGSKKSEEVDWVVDQSFEPRAPEDFWVAREQYLKRLKAESERIVPHESILQAVAGLGQGIPDVQAIAEIVAERERVYRRAETARGAAELNQLSEKVLDLTKQLSVKIKLRQDEEDILMLLLVI